MAVGMEAVRETSADIAGGRQIRKSQFIPEGAGTVKNHG
jgi:hypothetical protein